MSDAILPVLWYLVIGFSTLFYVLLDGFDLGVGMLHLFTKKDTERRLFLNAIGPVWDGNEVWLVVVGGGLFAGFPDVYATLFSGFYTLSMVLLCGLIFRVVAIEFRSKRPSPLWRYTWDAVFSIASFIITFGIGLVLGNLIEGVPLNADKEIILSFAHVFRPYPLLIGAFTCSLLMMHGSIFLCMKTEGALHERLRKWVNLSIVFFIFLYLIATFVTLRHMPHMIAWMREYPYLFLLGAAALGSFLLIPREFAHKRDLRAFLFSCLGISFLFSLFGIGTFPAMIRSSIDPANLSLTLFNAAASPLTLKVLLIIVAIGIPLVLCYGFYIYRVFRGKVKVGPHSY